MTIRTDPPLAKGAHIPKGGRWEPVLSPDSLKVELERRKELSGTRSELERRLRAFQIVTGRAISNSCRRNGLNAFEPSLISSLRNGLSRRLPSVSGICASIHPQSFYCEKNHAIKSVRAIKATEITSRLNLRIRLSYACVQLISRPLTGDRLAATINPLAFTYNF